MTKTTSDERTFDFGLTGRLGRPWEYGQKIFGWAGYGVEENLMDTNDGTPKNRYGIYQRRTRNGKTQFVREEFYWPTNPQTVPQQAWRATFKAGMVAWSNLTDEQKKAYNIKGTKIGTMGQNVFMKEYLNSH